MGATGQPVATPPPAASPAKFAALSPLARRLRVTDENRRWWTVVAMSLGLAMAMLDTTVVVVVVPTIQRNLNLSLSGLEWTISAYTLSHAMVLVTGGRLGDIFGRRKVYLIGLAIFSAGTAAVGAAPEQTVLLVGRAVQGVGAGLMMPSTLATVTQVFSAKERPRAIGIWTGVSSLALSLGPALGGLLVTAGSWRLAFFINLPIAVVAVMVTLLAAPETRDESAVRRIDVAGILTLTIGLGAILLAVIQSTDWGWSSARVLGLLAVSIVAIGAFVQVEGRVSAPMLDLGLFRSRQLVSGVLAALFIALGLLAMLLYVAIFMQSVLGYSVLETGLKFIPGTLSVALVAPRAGPLQQKIAPRVLMISGLLLVAAGIGLMTRTTVHSSYAIVLAASVLVGLGVGITSPAMAATAMSAIPRQKAGAASGMVSMARQFGFALGVAIVGTVFGGISRHAAEHFVAPLGLPAAARDGLVRAAAAGRTPDPGAVPAKVLFAVREAIAHGVSHALVVPAGIVAAGAVVVGLLTIGTPAATPGGGPRGRH